MRILILGNMGYIGPVVVHHLRECFPAGELIGFDTGFFGGCLTCAGAFPERHLDQQIYGDVRGLPGDIFDGADAVVYLAAISNDPMGKAYEQITMDVNHDSAVRAALEAKASGVRAFVFASSCSVYGFASQEPRTESSDLDPLTAYARSKVKAEKDLAGIANENFTVTCLRFATACGMSERLRLDLVVNDFVASAVASRKITILSDGTPWRPLIHIRDMARAIEWAITRPAQQGGKFLVVNTGSDVWNYQVRQLAEAVAAAIPNVQVSVNKEAPPDRRSYRVDFGLFRTLAPSHQPQMTLVETIRELKAGFEKINFQDSEFRKSRLIRLNALSELRSAGLLDEDLRWKGRNLPQAKNASTSQQSPERLKQKILHLTEEFSKNAHAANLPAWLANELVRFVPGSTTVPYAGRVFTSEEVRAAVGSTLDFWLTLGKEGEAFEKSLSEFLGVKSSVLCNSGSSANLLAMSALTSPRLGNQRLRPGDEVITVAAGFPTTVAPIFQNGLVPVFIDNDPLTLNARVEQLSDAYSPGKTKAVFMAHTLGNPFNLAAVQEFCKRNNLWLIEDNCDALGCRYDDQLTGTFGDLSTQSFYPPHHLTLGEGGAVNIVESLKLKVIVESFRDWGRDCWCASGKDNTCGKRFDWQLGDLPKGYDHKFVYSHLGYNLKPLDIQAAIGRVQLTRLPQFVEARIQNWDYLRRGLEDFNEFFDFMLPTHATGWSRDGFTWDNSGHRTVCSWFGFMLRTKPTAPFTKFELARHLDGKRIGNRMLFGGNLVRQPVLVQLRKDSPSAFRVIGDLSGADTIMNEVLFIGTYPGLTHPMLDYVIETIRAFVKRA